MKAIKLKRDFLKKTIRLFCQRSKLSDRYKIQKNMKVEKMLDFYMITDCEDIPECPNKENFIGQLSLEDLKSLKSIDEYANTLNIQLSYFEDFRITFKPTKSILQFAENRISTLEKGNTACQKFIDILSKAISCKSGIVAFCD